MMTPSKSRKIQRGFNMLENFFWKTRCKRKTPPVSEGFSKTIPLFESGALAAAEAFAFVLAFAGMRGAGFVHGDSHFVGAGLEFIGGGFATAQAFAGILAFAAVLV